MDVLAVTSRLDNGVSFQSTMRPCLLEETDGRSQILTSAFTREVTKLHFVILSPLP